jgi:hypothetical protein
MLTTGSHAENLSTPYRPIAIYYEESDSVEFIRADVPCIYRRVDDFLTLVIDMDNRALIGFRLKGFKNFYIRHFAKLNRSIKPDFLSLVSVLEKIIEQFADDLIEDSRRQAAYQQAREMAYTENATLRELPQAA